MTHAHFTDDSRLRLPEDNVFRYSCQNGMPAVKADTSERVNLRTAREIERERLEKKSIAPAG